jgi:isoleucyl-tRNA synthetase
LRDATLERQMALAQRLASLCHGLRKKHKLKVRQPLQKIVVPVLTDEQERDLAAIAPLLATEVNVLEVKPERDPRFLSKRIKPNFKVLGPKVGPAMKAVQAAFAHLTPDHIAQLENTGAVMLPTPDGQGFMLTLEDVEITVQDIPGYYTATEAGLTVALDITLTDELRQMGLARDLVNRIQNLRKDRGLEVTDRIRLWVQCPVADLEDVVQAQAGYIQDEVLATQLALATPPTNPETVDIDGLAFVLGLERA